MQSLENESAPPRSSILSVFQAQVFKYTVESLDLNDTFWMQKEKDKENHDYDDSAQSSTV
jgi:hypothetical protein